MLTSRGLKSPCALLLLPPQPPFSHATVFRREAQADAVGSGNSELCAVFQAFAHAVPSTCNAIPVFTTCLVLKHPLWLKSHHLFFEGLPDPRRHDCTSFVHHRGILRRSLLWGLRGFFLHVCSSPYVHTSLDSTDCASQKALKNHQNKTGHLLNLSPPLNTLYVTYVISNPGKNCKAEYLHFAE